MSSNKVWIPEVHDDILRNHVREMLDDYAIAAKMDFTISTVKKHRYGLGLPNSPRTSLGRKPEQGRKAPTGRPNPITLARTLLGRRLVEKEGGYWLDGTPVNLDTFMRAANRVQVELGAEQIVTCERWRVEVPTDRLPA